MTFMSLLPESTQRTTGCDAHWQVTVLRRGTTPSAGRFPTAKERQRWMNSPAGNIPCTNIWRSSAACGSCSASDGLLGVISLAALFGLFGYGVLSKRTATGAEMSVEYERFERA